MDKQKPENIVACILGESQFKTPNLSRLVMEKFEAPDYKEVLINELRDIVYADTICSIDVNMSVLPTKYQACKVSAQPHAILNLISEPPANTRARRNGSKAKITNSNDGKSTNGFKGEGQGNGKARKRRAKRKVKGDKNQARELSTNSRKAHRHEEKPNEDSMS